MQDWLYTAKEEIIRKMYLVRERSKEKIPFTCVDGIHDNRLDPNVKWTQDNGVNWWTNGFFAGMMWQMYIQTGKHEFLETARFTERALDQCFTTYLGLNHDIGFMWLTTAVSDFRVTGSEQAKVRGLHAANLLAGRFNPAGNFIRAWNDFGDGQDARGYAIIDSLMNLPLLYWAEGITKDFRYQHIAKKHADTILQYFLRSDGSVHHIVEFDPQTGAFICGHGGQGYADGSSWSRGQAWAIYGFALSYRYTKDKAFLDASKQVAHYFLAAIPSSGLVPVDFRQPDVNAPVDCSAAAIAACGMLELSDLVPDSEKKMYLGGAERLLQRLLRDNCDFSRDTDGILMRCSSSYGEKAHEYNLIYGDYYLMEAIFRISGEWLRIW